jgi:metallopeptidase MepB
MDTTELWNATKQRIITTSCGHDPRDWGAGQARFIHIFRHNDAGYFSYPLSMAYAADLFAATFAEDPMSAAAGRRWRYEVLEPGASRSEMGILEAFLVREPSAKAILDELKAEVT